MPYSPTEQMKTLIEAQPDDATYDELLREARDYVTFIEEYTETPVGMVSVGSDRNATIVRESPWTRS